MLGIASLVGVFFYNKVYIPKHTYKTVNVSNGDIDIKVSGVGEVDSKELYKIGAIYGGKVLDFTLQEGDFIKKGTQIAKIDSVDLKDKISELVATINKLQNDIDSLKIDKLSAKETASYQNDIFKKNEKLYKKGAISELDFKKFKTDSVTAKLKVSSLDAKVTSLYNQQAQLRASLAGLVERLSRYTIKAPVSGYITKKYISNFAIINPNQTLIDIVNPNDVWVATHIDTRISGDVKIGDKATITLRSSSKKYKGRVVNIKPINNDITYEREIDVVFENLPIPFYLQEQAEVKIITGKLNNVSLIPAKTISFHNKKDGVWIVEDSKAKFKPLKIITYSKSLVAVENIGKNDSIIVPNPKKKPLSDGMKIYKVGR